MLLCMQIPASSPGGRPTPACQCCLPSTALIRQHKSACHRSLPAAPPDDPPLPASAAKLARASSHRSSATLRSHSSLGRALRSSSGTWGRPVAAPTDRRLHSATLAGAPCSSSVTQAEVVLCSGQHLQPSFACTLPPWLVSTVKSVAMLYGVASCLALLCQLSAALADLHLH